MPSDDISRVVPAFAPNTLIKSSEMNPELNQLVNMMNTKMSRAVAQNITANNTFSGSNTFSGQTTFSIAPKTDSITENNPGAGVSVDQVLLKDGSIRLTGSNSYAPAANGDFGYNTTTHQYLGQANGQTVVFTSGVAGIVPITGNVSLTAGDKGKIYNALNNLTISIAAPGTLGSPWWFYVNNDGTGTVVIDPTGSPTIDGKTTLNLYPKESALIFSDGSNFKSMFRNKGEILLGSTTVANVTAVDFTNFINSDFDEFRLSGSYVLPATDSVDAFIRFSIDGGSSFLSSAQYTYQSGDFVGSSINATGANQIRMNRNSIGNGSGQGLDFTLKFYKPSGSQLSKSGTFNLGWRGAATGLEGANGNYIVSTGSTINAVRFLFSSGNIMEGSFKLFGIRN